MTEIKCEYCDYRTSEILYCPECKKFVCINCYEVEKYWCIHLGFYISDPYKLPIASLNNKIWEQYI